MLEFRARISAVASHQVKVRGWDVTAKEPVIGQADAETLQLSGPLTLPVVTELKEQAAAGFSSGTPTCIDLTDVQEIDLAGLQLLA